MSRVSLGTVAILVSLGLVVYVIVIGGIVCVIQDTYTFSQYLEDLHKLLNLLFAVLAAALVHAMIQAIERHRAQEHPNGPQSSREGP